MDYGPKLSAGLVKLGIALAVSAVSVGFILAFCVIRYVI